jgi:hypothetical protein
MREKVDSYIKNKEFESIYESRNIKLFNKNKLDLGTKGLKSFSSSGAEKIHNMFLKHLPKEFFLLMLILFSLSLSHEKIPIQWSLSNVTMIPKKLEDKSNPR